MLPEPLVTPTPRGIFCPRGDFYIDPWESVKRAVITHAHADHARPGSERYLTTNSGRQILQMRLGAQAVVDGIEYGHRVTLGSVQISLHPAGHILGSAQVRLEHQGHVCVVSGDYTIAANPTAEAFEPIRCHHFVSECTFGLPIFRWPAETDVFEQLHDWWKTEQTRQRTCILFAYSLGKAQRIVYGVDTSIGPVLAHGAVLRLVSAYRQEGIRLPDIAYAGLAEAKSTRGRALVIAPPSTGGSSWIKKFGPVSLAMASGWMQIRGLRRRKSLDRGFVLSDHADWQGLNDAIVSTGAERVWLTHGSTGPMTRWLLERGLETTAIPTQFHGETDEPDPVLEADTDTGATPPVSSEAP